MDTGINATLVDIEEIRHSSTFNLLLTYWQLQSILFLFVRQLELYLHSNLILFKSHTKLNNHRLITDFKSK